MELPGKRIQRWREYIGKSVREFEALTEIPYSTLKTLENNTDPSKKPSWDVVAKLRKSFPELNIDWLFDEGDTEPMLREDRALVRRDSQETVNINMAAESNPDSYKHQFDALLALVKTGFFGSPEQLLKGLSKKTSASPDAASLFETVDAIAASYPIYVEPGFKQAARQLQFG